MLLYDLELFVGLGMAIEYGWYNRRMIWAYALLWMMKGWISTDNVGYLSTIPGAPLSQHRFIATSIQAFGTIIRLPRRFIHEYPVRDL
jgi:hypothetical protein